MLNVSCPRLATPTDFNKLEVQMKRRSSTVSHTLTCRVLGAVMAVVLAFGCLPASAIAEVMQEEAQSQNAVSPLADKGSVSPKEAAQNEAVEYAVEDEQQPTHPLDGLDNEDEAQSTFTGGMPIQVQAPTIHDANEHTGGGLQLQSDALPSAYDSREHGFVTPVKNQNPFGVCWAFATIGAIESSLLAHNLAQASGLDLSERHLAYFTTHQQDDALHNITGDGVQAKGNAFGSATLLSDPYLVSGGNSFVAEHVLATWAGPAKEEVAPYEELIFKQLEITGGASNFSNEEQGERFLDAVALDPSLARSKNVAWLTGYRHIAWEDSDEVKAAIIENGGVTMKMRNDDQYLRATIIDGKKELAFYSRGENLEINHEVELVGWNDDFDRFRFTFHPLPELYEGTTDLPQDSIVSDIGLDEEKVVSRSGDDWYRWFKFTPSTTGVYRFSSTNAYPDSYLYDMSNQKLAKIPTNSSYAYQPNCGNYELFEGNTYYFCICLDSGEDTVKVSRLGDVDLSDAPQHNGAWLVKNSFGSARLGSGYLWISYDELSIAGSSVGAFIASPTKPYDNNYQYDGSAADTYNHVRSGGSVASVFEAKANPSGAEELRAVSLWSYSANVDYAIQVYLNPTNPKNPTSGTPALAQPVTGATTHAGYYTMNCRARLFFPRARGTQWSRRSRIRTGPTSTMLWTPTGSTTT